MQAYSRDSGRRVWVRGPLRDFAVREFLMFAGFVGVWYVLNRWLLPRLGVPT